MMVMIQPELMAVAVAGGFGAYELSSEVRRAAEYKLNLFGERVRVPRIGGWMGKNKGKRERIN